MGDKLGMEVGKRGKREGTSDLRRTMEGREDLSEVSDL